MLFLGHVWSETAYRWKMYKKMEGEALVRSFCGGASNRQGALIFRLKCITCRASNGPGARRA